MCVRVGVVCGGLRGLGLPRGVPPTFFSIIIPLIGGKRCSTIIESKTRRRCVYVKQLCCDAVVLPLYCGWDELVLCSTGVRLCCVAVVHWHREAWTADLPQLLPGH